MFRSGRLIDSVPARESAACNRGVALALSEATIAYGSSGAESLGRRANRLARVHVSDRRSVHRRMQPLGRIENRRDRPRMSPPEGTQLGEFAILNYTDTAGAVQVSLERGLAAEHVQSIGSPPHSHILFLSLDSIRHRLTRAARLGCLDFVAACREGYSSFGSFWPSFNPERRPRF